MRPFKRSRFGRGSRGRGFFRKRRRAIRNFANTAQWGKPSGQAQFRTRKLNKRRWRAILWRDTQSQPHYRSFAHLALSLVAGLTTGFGNGIVYLRPAITVEDQPYHTLPFWTTGGGAQPIDTGVPVPLFSGDVVQRGGMCRIVITNPDSAVPVRVKVFGVWAREVPKLQVYANTHATVFSQEFDPSIVPDFHEFGSVMFRREVLLLPGAQPFEVTHRLKPQKHDQNVFMGNTSLIVNSNPAGNQLWWCFQMVPQTSNAAVDNLSVLISFNLSFSADAVGTT